MQQTQKQRNIEILINFVKKQPNGCSTTQMREHLEDMIESTKPITLKTIQNYMRDLKANYVESVEPIKLKKGFYKIKDHRTPINQIAIEMEKKTYLKLAIEVLEGLSDISKHHKEVVDDLKLEKVATAYYVKPEEYEKINTDEEEIELLEEAILSDTIIIFTYKKKQFHVEPYRLVNFDGIWYLYGKDKEERSGIPHKTWMLEFIDKIEIDYGNKHNTLDETIDDHLENADSAKFVLGKQFDMRFRVAAEVAEVFKRRNHLPDQNSVLQKDGSLLVTSTVSSYEDIDREIKSWLPYIEVLEPQEYKVKLLHELKGYWSRFKDEI